MSDNQKKDNKLTKTQNYLLDLLSFVHDLCIENDIKYSLDCGTLIGAVRENGFITWDDDADIIFKRLEYEKFLKVLKNTELPDYVGVYYPEEKEYFFDFDVRLYYKKDRVRDDEDSIKLYDGIYSFATLDLFVLDNIPENNIKNRLFVLKQQLVFGLAMSKRHDIKFKKYTVFERIAICFLSFIGRFYNITTLCKLHNECSIAYTGKTNLLYCTSWSPEYPGYQFNSRLFDEYVLADFENLKLYITKSYDKVLRIEYGDDYMIPKRTHDHENYSSKL